MGFAVHGMGNEFFSKAHVTTTEDIPILVASGKKLLFVLKACGIFVIF